MQKVSQEHSAAPLAWSTPRLVKLGTIASVAGSGVGRYQNWGGHKS